VSYSYSNLPDLSWEQWRDTADTLHIYMQIVGKTRLALTVMQNHWWNVPLYLTSRGIWKSAMQIDGDESLEIAFDFLSHKLTFHTSGGGREPLR
jgi:hypothetical protein